MSAIVTTTQPVAVEYGGLRVAATFDEKRGYWVYKAEVLDDVTPNEWHQFASGSMPEFGAKDSPQVLIEVTNRATQWVAPRN